MLPVAYTAALAIRFVVINFHLIFAYIYHDRNLDTIDVLSRFNFSNDVTLKFTNLWRPITFAPYKVQANVSYCLARLSSRNYQGRGASAEYEKKQRGQE